MQLIKKEKCYNKVKYTIFGFLKFSYKIKNALPVGFFGDFSSWDEASQKCGRFSDEIILQKTLESVLKVKNGQAVFERDSVIFDKIQYSYPLLSCLLKVGIECNNTLNILDFGGALGSHYFQNKEFLKPINIENWTVVEQPHYIKAGNEQIADGILNFKNSIDEVNNANLFLASSVIQYLDKPYEWVERFINKGINYMLFDRLQLNFENKDRLTIQTAPPEIYNTSFPSWFLNEKKFLSLFQNKYDLILDFESNIDKANIPHKYKGYLFKKKP